MTATAVALGSGTMSKGESQRVLREWERAANGGRRAVQRLGLEETAALFGIPIVVEKPDV